MAVEVDSILVDTSVWIDAFLGRTPKILSVTQGLLNDDRVLTCGPVIFEIKRGLKKTERKEIMSLFDALIRLPLEEEIWDEAGDLDSALRRKGITVPPMDILIAEVCLYHRTTLFTLDEHFHSVPGLRLFIP